MKRLFKIKYPKIITLILVGLFAYFIFTDLYFATKIENLHSLNYLSSLLFGMLFSFGFTTPFAMGYFLTLNPTNILLTGIVAGFGAMISDFLIFKFVKFSFNDEFERLKKEKLSRKIDHEMKKIFGRKIKHYLMYAFSGIIIASPLPDEVGVTMLAGLTDIKPSILAIVSFIGNTTGIIIMLAL